MNKNIYESEYIRDKFDFSVIDISLGNSLERIGTFGIAKIWSYLKINLKLLYTLLTRRHSACYMTIATGGAPFLKDSILVLWLKIFRVPRIFHLHGKGINSYISKGGIRKWYYNFIYKKATVIHLSYSLLDDLKEINSIKNKFVVSNGIKSLGLRKVDHRGIRFIYVSNFFESKGALDLLKAFQIVDGKYGNISLTMIGGWPDDNFKKKLNTYLATNTWKNKVEILGPVYGIEKNAAFAGSDILIFPSQYQLECFPLVILEAMSCGLCVIASTVGAIPEMLDGGNAGLLIDKVNAESIAKSIEKLINNRDLVIELGKAGLMRYNENYTEHAFEENWVNAISRSIE